MIDLVIVGAALQALPQLTAHGSMVCAISLS